MQEGATVQATPSAVTILAIETPTLADRSYLVHDGRIALVVDPQRDIDRVLAPADDAGARITHIFETHIHNNYLTGGLALGVIAVDDDYTNAGSAGLPLTCSADTDRIGR